MTEFMTVMEMAETLKISRSKAYQLIKLPDIPIIKIGKNIRIDKNKFFSWLHNQKNVL